MTTASENSRTVWDFSPVFDLVKTLNSSEPVPEKPPLSVQSQPRAFKSSGDPGLGNFDQIWDYLKVNQEPASSVAPHFEVSAGQHRLRHDAYISDGPVYYATSSKHGRLDSDRKLASEIANQTDGGETRKAGKIPKSSESKTAKKTPRQNSNAKAATNTNASSAEVFNTARQRVAEAVKSWKLEPKPESEVEKWPIADPYQALQKSIPVTTDSKPKEVTPVPSRHHIRPVLNQSKIDRNWNLFLKVLQTFPDDREYLVSPLQLSINRPQPDGIHVFVDASNILIGFADHVRRARKLPAWTRIRVNLNFHALALLLERRRPVAKRVLAGSMPEIQAFEEARQVGYETCILDKVYKARELTDRQRQFAGYSSDNADQPQQAKWVEQAVDEILHLKICESIIDTPAEAGPTMVVATGDAAEAEYSPGFLKMVERALAKGWHVEVMAFGRSVSMGYRRLAKLPASSHGKFKVIELDDYAEELFDES